RLRLGDVEQVVSQPVEQLDSRRDLPVVLHKETVEARVVTQAQVPERLLQAGVADRVRTGFRRQIRLDRRERVLEILARDAVVAGLPNLLIEIETGGIAVPDAGTTKVRDARYDQRWTGGRCGVERSELMTPGKLDAQLIKAIAAHRRDRLH